MPFGHGFDRFGKISDKGTAFTPSSVMKISYVSDSSLYSITNPSEYSAPFIKTSTKQAMFGLQSLYGLKSLNSALVFSALSPLVTVNSYRPSGITLVMVAATHLQTRASTRSPLLNLTRARSLEMGT